MKLKILLWNLQDLFIILDKYQSEDLDSISEAKYQQLNSSFKVNKPIDKVRALADLIIKVKPDICLFTEVGGEESLNNLNLHFLGDDFKVLHKQSNSDRGIDLGILVSKRISIPYSFKIHKQKVFARGVLELSLDINKNHLHFLVTHLKSKLNLKGKDFEGRTQRRNEVSKLIEIGAKIQMQAGHEVFIAGDFNGIIAEDSDDHELDDFATKLGLLDVLEHQNTPFFDRTTYIYYNNNQESLMQLDYFLMHPRAMSMISKGTEVLDFCGESRTIFPKNRAEKMIHPSDHYPLQIVLNLDQIKF